MLAMGRALMARAEGAAARRAVDGPRPDARRRDLRHHPRRSTPQGTTILLVEQNARMALQVADRGYVIETGRILLTDSADNLRENEEVRNSYLGIA